MEVTITLHDEDAKWANLCSFNCDMELHEWITMMLSVLHKNDTKHRIVSFVGSASMYTDKDKLAEEVQRVMGQRIRI